jgi:hypothetical protein
MTDQQIDVNVDAYEAWLKGEPVEIKQFRFEDVWIQLGQSAAIDSTTILRRKPAPKLRPWKPEEVPMGCVVRRKDNHGEWTTVAGCVGGDVMLGVLRWTESFDKCWETCEHSIDGGKTWKPCGVEE